MAASLIYRTFNIYTTVFNGIIICCWPLFISWSKELIKTELCLNYYKIPEIACKINNNVKGSKC